MKTKKRTGRPTKAAKPGVRASLGLKVTAEIKGKLEFAASGSGRTQSQEAEYRLEKSFDREELLGPILEIAFGPQVAALTIMIATAMNDTGRQSATWRVWDQSERGKIPNYKLQNENNWTEDAYAFDQAVASVHSLLESARPPGDPAPPKLFPPGHDQHGLEARQGTNTAKWMVTAIDDPESSWARPIRKMLGEKVAKRMIAKTDMKDLT